MLRRVLIFLIFGFFPLFLVAQNPNGNYNPFVNQGIIAPSPLWPVEQNGKGTASFNLGNTGSDVLTVYPDQHVILTITLSDGEPDHLNPLSAVSGTFASLFSWSYNAGTYTAVQIANIPAKSSGTIIIAYRVIQNSSSPGSNGFNVNLTPAPYQTASNSQNDDAVSSYTFTEIRDYGDAPAGYGSVFHALDFENYLGNTWDGEEMDHFSAAADGDDNHGLDDEDGVTFPAGLTQGEAIDVSVFVKGIGRLNAWIDWNGDGDFGDAGERIADNIICTEGVRVLSIVVPLSANVSAPTYGRFRLSSGTLSSSSGSAMGGEVEDYRITISSSTNAPSVPTGLVLNSVSPNAVSISWNASTDGVEGYRVYRNGLVVGTTAALSYTDNTVNDGLSYTYSVSAYNTAGYESAQSPGLIVNIDDVSAPSVPSNLTVTSVKVDAVTIYWQASTDNIGVSGYNIFRDGVLLGSSTSLYYSDLTVSEGNTYSYTVAAFDAAGNISEQSLALLVSTNDTEPPSRPDGLIIEAVSSNSITFSWGACTDNTGVLGYRVFRSGILIGTTSGLSYTDQTVLAGNSYTYTVSAFDAAGNTSPKSPALTASIDDDAPPTTPSGLHAISVSGNAVTLAWNASEDNISVSSYRVYRDGTMVGTSTGLTYTDNTVSGVPCTYTVSAIDNAGNESEQSGELEVRFDDKTPPAVPTGLQVSSATVNSVSLLWNAATDNIGVVAYRVYRMGTYLETVTSLTYIDNSVIVGGYYTYSITAIDAAGNESDLSRIVAVSTDDITPPTVPGGLITTSVTSDAIGLSWDPSTDDVEFAGYRVYRSGIFLEMVAEPVYLDATASVDVSNTYTVSAMDAAGNESEQSAPLIVHPLSDHQLITYELSIFPNPNDGKFLIDLGGLSGKYVFQIVSSSGSIVSDNIVMLDGSPLTLNYDDLGIGLYYIRIFNIDSYYQGKLVVVR